MTADEIYSIWAPREGIWSPWVKPVLFAHLQMAGTTANTPQAASDAAAVPGLPDACCVVVDMPGPRSVAIGMVLAARAFRPIPLFNAIPSPIQSAVSGTMAAVDVRPIIWSIVTESAALSALPLPVDAPPTFLLDFARAVFASPCRPGLFDNRSVSLPTDFPSGNLLRSRGIECAVVLQPRGFVPQPDLTHTLLRWQQAGMKVLIAPIDDGGNLAEATLRRPIWYRSVFHRFIATLGFRRNRLGGFGGTLPHGFSGG